MRRSFSRHDSFFSSLSQVEKRLASEEAEEAEPSSSSSSSSPSPLFLLSNNPEPIHHQATANTGAGSSEPPLDFLSNSPTNTTQFQQQQQEAPDNGDDTDDDDDIDQLFSLLGLSLPPNQNDHYYSSCDCSCSQGGGGFFRKVVGVKGPRCGKEMERLDAWIRTLHSSKSRREPARLAHLLLGKAAALASDDGTDGFGAVGFPATVHDFLDHDPPPQEDKEE